MAEEGKIVEWLVSRLKKEKNGRMMAAMVIPEMNNAPTLGGEETIKEVVGKLKNFIIGHPAHFVWDGQSLTISLACARE